MKIGMLVKIVGVFENSYGILYGMFRCVLEYLNVAGDWVFFPPRLSWWVTVASFG